MDDQPTCGKGLAEHASLPAKLGELSSAMAKLLEFHQTTLDLTDETRGRNTRPMQNWRSRSAGSRPRCKRRRCG